MECSTEVGSAAQKKDERTARLFALRTAHKGLPKKKAFSGRGEARRKVKPFQKTAHKEA